MNTQFSPPTSTASYIPTETVKDTVLIVDDEAVNLELMASLLSPQYQTLVAPSGERALSIIEGPSPPDIILLDIEMDGMNGYELCRKIKQTPRTSAIPVIFVTVHGDSGAELEGFKYGAADYITKPFNASLVLARVATHIALYRQHRELERLVAERTRELEHSLQEREQLLQIKDDFLATMSHELRTPLSVILGNVELLEEEEKSASKRQQLHAIKTAGHGQLTLVDNILDVLNIESGQFSIDQSPYDFDAMMQEVVPGKARLAEALGLTFSVRNETPIKGQMMGDQRRIIQILGNLLGNAIKWLHNPLHACRTGEDPLYG